MNRTDVIIFSNIILVILSIATSVLVSIYIFKKVKNIQGIYIAIVYVLLFLIIFGSFGGSSLGDYTLDSRIDDKIDNYFKRNKENQPKTFILYETKNVSIFHNLEIGRELYYDEYGYLQIYDTRIFLNGFTAGFSWKEKPGHSLVNKVGNNYVFHDIFTNFSKILIFYLSTYNTRSESKIPVKVIEETHKEGIGYFYD